VFVGHGARKSRHREEKAKNVENNKHNCIGVGWRLEKGEETPQTRR